MAQYIDKSALVEEIERLDALYHTSRSLGGDLFIQGLYCFLDTLEVKEVDLEKEIDTQWNKFVDSEGEVEQFSEIAKHFFELGMSVSNKAQKGEKV